MTARGGRSNVGPMSTSPAPRPDQAQPIAPHAGPDSVALRWTVLGLLCLAFMAAYFDRVNLSVAMTVPAFKSFFALNDTRRGVLNSVFFWSYFAMQIPAGWLVDRYGAKRTLAVGLLLWSVTAAATGLAQTFLMVAFFRLLLGVGESAVNPAGMRWIRFNMPEHRRGMAIGIYQASAKIGPAVGMLLAGHLTARYGWRPMFLILGLGCLLWLIPWMALVRDDDRAREAAQQRTSPAPSVPLRQLLGNPIIWGTIIGTIAYQYSVYYCMTWMPAYFVDRWHMSTEKMGLYSGFSFGGMAVVAILAGIWADRLIVGGRDAVKVRRAFIIAGLLLGSTEIIGALAHNQNTALFFAIFSLSGLGLATANYWAITQTLIPGGSVGRIVGVQNAAAQIPGIAAPLLTGWLRQKTGSYVPAMSIIAVLLGLGIIAYLTLVRRKYSPAPAV
jgi:ACS family D-galactonate transporter-like MFS transporter